MVKQQESSKVLVPGLVGIFGPNGTIKTSQALGWPHKIALLDLELGSQRAWQLQEFIDEDLVEVFKFPLPVKDVHTRYSELKGQSELWADFTKKINEVLEDNEYQTVVIDTATALWQLIRDSYLQELQLADKEKNRALRKQLLQIEHGEPNRRMSHIVQMAGVYGKWVVLVHHDTDEYVPLLMGGQPVIDAETQQAKRVVSGKRIADGWNKTGPALDWQFQSELVGTDGPPKPRFTIRDKTSGGIHLINLPFDIETGRDKQTLFRKLELVNGAELTQEEKDAAEAKAAATAI